MNKIQLKITNRKTSLYPPIGANSNHISMDVDQSAHNEIFMKVPIGNRTMHLFAYENLKGK